MESSEAQGMNARAGAGTLVCFAVKEEAAAFRKVLADCSGIEILVAGMGRTNSEKMIRQRLSAQPPGLVLTCGFAGALNPELKVGDVLFDADVEAKISEKLRAAGAKMATFYCAPRVATTGGEKAELRRATGADVVEMESGVIRAICREKKIPSATIRAISDAANEDLPLDFNALMTEEQKISFPKLALALAKSPGKVPRLLELQRKTQLAARSLAEVLEKLLGCGKI